MEVDPVWSTNTQQTPKLGREKTILFLKAKKILYKVNRDPHPAAQFPATVPDLSVHSVEEKQVPLRLAPFLYRQGKKTNKKQVPNCTYRLWVEAQGPF